ncbi:MAG: VWA domain-containing protein [Bacilli bacterium]|jgi:hypothetical protein|nr:VWA domain-containing protein [Bacilli bacterium]HHX67155.1 VWA domain-containing protein [Gallicola sp.]
MKKILLSLTIIFASYFFFGCAARAPGDYSPYPGRGDSDTVGDPAQGGQNGNHKPAPGQLTASEWSDLDNYDFYLSLFDTDQGRKKGVFAAYFTKGYFDTLNMVDVTVTSGENIVAGASVQLLDDAGNIIYQGVTNAFGTAYLFPKESQIEFIEKVKVNHGEESVSVDYTYNSDNASLEIDIDTINDKKEVIEIMFVIDTTGSMGDELSYLKSEIDNVISRVQATLTNTSIRLALLFYRDTRDAYVTRYFDFTTDIQAQKKNLARQSAGGGGDFEEAVDVALSEAVSKEWGVENSTKLLIHVLDAPPHYTQVNMTRYFDAIYQASKKGIRMIPVASSGIDKYTEYLLRNEAMMTGGTYVFLTDDSGIGNDHLEASVGETVVEYLNLLLVRVITEYHMGVKLEKIPYYNQNQ